MKLPADAKARLSLFMRALPRLMASEQWHLACETARYIYCDLHRIRLLERIEAKRFEAEAKAKERDRVAKWMATPAGERALLIWQRVAVDGETMVGVGADLGISRSRVSQILHKEACRRKIPHDEIGWWRLPAIRRFARSEQ